MSDPVLCLHCGGPERPGAPLLAIGPGASVGWLHPGCYPVWLKTLRREREAGGG